MTGPTNGSDATGTIGQGKVVKINDKICIDLEINKGISHYPIVNLIGVAFDLEDPLTRPNRCKKGVTLALFLRTHNY